MSSSVCAARVHLIRRTQSICLDCGYKTVSVRCVRWREALHSMVFCRPPSATTHTPIGGVDECIMYIYIYIHIYVHILFIKFNTWSTIHTRKTAYISVFSWNNRNSIMWKIAISGGTLTHDPSITCRVLLPLSYGNVTLSNSWIGIAAVAMWFFLFVKVNTRNAKHARATAPIPILTVKSSSCNKHMYMTSS